MKDQGAKILNTYTNLAKMLGSEERNYSDWTDFPKKPREIH